MPAPGATGLAARRAARPVLLMALLALLVLGGVARHAAASAHPRCYGAASMDREKPCTNSKLRLLVRPTPDGALLTPDAGCTPVESAPPVPGLCAFGVAPAKRAGATVALLGDSHASHWRAAVDQLAGTERWHAISLARSGCPYTSLLLTAVPSVRGKCVAWFESIAPWFAAHPEVATVFVSSHTGVSFPVPEGTTLYEEKVSAAIQTWNALPASVRHIVVLRDPAITRVSTPDCVTRAIRRRVPAGPACAVPRGKFLRPDSLVSAAERMRSPRVQVIDLTSFMCTSKSCPPVVGGVLVHKDQHHLTEAFSRSLGPYLRRGLRRLMAGWR